MWAALVTVFSALAQFLAFLPKLWEWGTKQLALIRRKKALEDLKIALDEAKQKKDTSKLDQAFGRREE